MTGRGVLEVDTLVVVVSACWKKLLLLLWLVVLFGALACHGVAGGPDLLVGIHGGKPTLLAVDSWLVMATGWSSPGGLASKLVSTGGSVLASI